jgi:hypothetical protein
MLSLAAGGCQEKAKKNNWQNVSLEELMPKGAPMNTKDTIVGLSFFIFEVDSGKYPDVRACLAGQSDLQSDTAASISSANNGIVCGSGSTHNWPQIAKSLADANAAVLNRTTLFMTANISEKINVGSFPQGVSVCYQTADKAAASVGLPAGNVILDINTTSLIGLKQACRLEIRPVYETLTKNSGQKRIPSWQYAFDDAGCKSIIRPGEFVFLAPKIDESERSEQRAFANIGQLLFANNYNETRIKFYLIICGLIKD